MRANMHMGLWALGGVVCTLASCTSRDVVATVGSREITQADVALAKRTGAMKSPEQTLDALVAREQLAAGAVDKGLMKDPVVASRIKAATREILAQSLLDAELGTIDEAALREHFASRKAGLSRRQIHLAHIYFSVPGGNAEAREAHSRASGAWARLLGGEDFARVAKEVSEDPGSADKGGDLGLVTEGQVAKEVFDAAAELKPDESSKPIRTPFGLHILKALSPITTTDPTFDEAKGQLLVDVRRDAEEALVKRLSEQHPATKYLERLHEEAHP